MLQDARRARNALGPGSASQDVTEARRLEEELARRELFDEATGLADAALLADRAAVALARAGQSGAQVAVPAVGLGALEEVASTVGDEAADAVGRGASRGAARGAERRRLTLVRGPDRAVAMFRRSARVLVVLARAGKPQG